MKFGTYTLQTPLFSKIPLATQNSKMAAPKSKMSVQKCVFFLYKPECIDYKPHKCIKVEYKVGHCGYFGTKYMSVSLMILEIGRIGTFTDSGEQYILTLIVVK